MTRRRLQFLTAVVFFLCASCGGAEELADLSSVDDADGSDASTVPAEEGAGDEGVDSTSVDDVLTSDGFAVVKYVTLANPDLPASLRARYAVPADDADDEPQPGCKSMEVDYDETSPRMFCFDRNPSDAPHYMSLIDSDGGEVIRLYAGTHCRQTDVKAGHYTMEICHAGGAEAEAETLIFIAGTDISVDAAPADDAEDEDGSDYDYEDAEDGESETLNAVRFSNASQELTFLATDTCVRCDLTGADFSGVDFTAIGGGIATLTGSDLTSADLTGANLTGATMNKVKLDDATMDNVILTSANLTSATLQRATLTAAVMTGANFTRARLDDVDLTGANLASANLTRARLNRAVLVGANMNAATMTYVVVEGADLTGATLTGGINMSYAKAGGADFTNANFTNAIATYAYFNGATMTAANLNGVNILRARFNSADLTTTNLTGALNATQAVWKSTILTGATWTDGTACAIAPSVSYYDPSTSKCD